MTEEKEPIVQNRKQRKALAKAYKFPLEVFAPMMRPWTKEHEIGRNDACPCGEGKSVEWADGFIENIPNKYKNCCMKTGKYENYKTN